MELSLLCDVNIYLYMHDTSNNRVVHFQSNAEADLRNVFKTRSSREFYSNADYVRLNGMESLNSLSYVGNKEEQKNSDHDEGSGTVSEGGEEDKEHPENLNKDAQGNSAEDNKDDGDEERQN